MEAMHCSQRVAIAAATLLLAVAWCGCAGHNQPEKETINEPWQARAAHARGYSPPDQRRIIDLPEVAPAAGPGATTVDPAQKPLPDAPVTFNVHQSDVAVLLRALARSAGIGIIVNETVTGKTSLHVEKVPWNRVFEGILKTHHLSFVWEGDLLRILSLEDKAQMAQLLEAERQILAKQREMALSEPLMTKIVHVDYADAAKLQANLARFLSESDNGKVLGSVLLDDHNNALIVQATRRDLERIVTLVRELDRPLAQVLIEAHIIEATSETARELGVQWGGLYTGGDYWITPNAGDAIGIGATDPLDPASGWAANFPADLTSTLPGVGFTLGAIIRSGDLLLAAQLNALEKEGKLNILSKPSITTLDNQTAIIESGDEVPFQTVDDNNVQIEYKKAVLRLEVTPHVIEGDTLKMDIITNKDELDFTRTVSGNPTVVTKKAVTSVVLFDGQTTVIGGLNKQTERSLDYGLPWLRHIPGLGALFRGSSNNQQMQDLLIFITPHILQRRPPLVRSPGEPPAGSIPP